MEDEAKEAPVLATFEVVTSSLSSALSAQALQIVSESMVGVAVEKDAASKVKRKMDELHGGTWHCIVGSDFGVSLCYETKNLMFMKSTEGGKHVLLFKSYDADRHVANFQPASS